VCLLLVQILAGHVILRYLPRANFFFVVAIGFFYAEHCTGFEGIAFFEQFFDALRVCILEAGYVL
jgi:hypothetical protein